MKPSMKMGLIVLIGVCVVFYQYHLSTGVKFDQVTDFGTAEGQVSYVSGNTQINEQRTNDSNAPKITEDAIRLAVKTVQKANGLSPDVGDDLYQELVNRLSKILTIVPKSDASRLEHQWDTDEALDHKMAAGSSRNGERMPASAVQMSPDSASSYKRNRSNSILDPLYIITPTYRRPEQIPELTRMSHTLMLVENVHWLVIEDAKIATPQVTRLLNRTGIRFEHLVAPMPEKYKQKKGAKPRGVSNRNRGLEWIRANASRGVLYFADDDNTYDIDLFEEIRRTRRVSMFPVGLCTKFGLSTPIVKHGKFMGFYDGWTAGRKFPVDMAGFAVSVEFLLKRPNATMPYRAGFEEDGFLKSLAPFEPREVELLADNCTRILAWHTQTKKNEPSANIDMKQHHSTNLVVLKQQMV